MAALIVAAEDPAATVEPHCVHELEDAATGEPAVDQSTARLGAIIPDHAWPHKDDPIQNHATEHKDTKRSLDATFGMNTSIRETLSHATNHKGQLRRLFWISSRTTTGNLLN
jgi:hypothetical protein